MSKKPVFINTCVFHTAKLPLVREYSKEFTDSIGFEILPMFDLPEYEDCLKSVLDVFQDHKISFHGPVFEVEHSAKRGTKEYERSMWHIRKTLEYARILHSSHLTMHLNNCQVLPGKKDEMLVNALENYQELRELFGAFACKIAIENTGTRITKDLLLDQQEFTDLCRDQHFDVLIDVGHAHANGWDIPRLIEDLSGQICCYHLHNNDGIHDLHNRIHQGTMDMDEVLSVIRRLTPDADFVIEYVRENQEGEGLKEDIREIMKMYE